MIQRIQTLYTALVVFINVVFLFKLKQTFSLKFDTIDVYGIIVLISILLVVILGIITIFIYKKRLVQMQLLRVALILESVILGAFVYRLLTLSGEMAISMKDIWVTIPLVSIVLLALARRAVQSDENLVKSVDRLR